MKSAVLVSFARTPIAAMNGGLSSMVAPAIGAAAISGALGKLPGGVSSVDGKTVEVLMGNVVSAGIGQAPARQAAKASGLSDATQCTTINKVCASGMKTAMYGSMSIMMGSGNIVVAGGFENMSRIPHYLMGGRTGGT